MDTPSGWDTGRVRWHETFEKFELTAYSLQLTAYSLQLTASIFSLILINKALGHPKMRFSGFRPIEFLFVHPPPKTAPKMGFLTS